MGARLDHPNILKIQGVSIVNINDSFYNVYVI